MTHVRRRAFPLQIISRPAREKGVTHFAILDVEDQANLIPNPSRLSVRYELLPPLGLQANVHDPNGWTTVRHVDDPSSLARLRRIWRAGPQTYDAVGNNCEHFVSNVEHGERRSPQVGGWALALIGLVLLFGD